MSQSPTVKLKRKRVWPIKCGHPWIFSGAVASTEGVDEATDQVVVVDDQGDVIGHGLFSANSQIRVRLYERTDTGELEPPGVSFFAERIQRAVVRRAILGLPGEQTTGYRLINSEGDGLPGAVVDRWEDLVAMQLTTAFMDRHRETFVSALQQELGADVAILEVAAPAAMARQEGFAPTSGWRGEGRREQVIFRENGVIFEVDAEAFQKTGHYADMRVHRRWLARRCGGKEVFDGYCYTGGFGLSAACAGASRVVCVDSSAAALKALHRNAELNEVQHLVEAREAKVDDTLRSAYDRGERFDVIILDPPKLAPRKEHKKKALKVYEALTIQALRVLKPQGIIAVGSCSQAIGPEELERVLGTCCGRDGLWTDVIYRGTQAPDHPVPAGMREGRYLSLVAAQRR